MVKTGGGVVNPGSESSADLPVLQAPAMFPPVRVALPRPVAGTAPASAGAQVLGAGTVGVRGPVVRGSLTQAGSTPESANGSTSAMGRPTPRHGYRQYLRSARTGQVAAIAVPGLVGLLATTASGVVTGYRQANCHRYLRSEAARFLPVIVDADGHGAAAELPGPRTRGHTDHLAAPIGRPQSVGGRNRLRRNAV